MVRPFPIIDEFIKLGDKSSVLSTGQEVNFSPTISQCRLAYQDCTSIDDTGYNSLPHIDELPIHFNAEIPENFRELQTTKRIVDLK